ncbi:PAAR domain-containing protein [Pseudomonas xantholysinigenes]|uniref:PAAR domain-containing protein n=1 Tax=Pseudomonas xantholysinigenes TaxID=2745490 RepID=UPI001CED6EF5|nr:PAAR domain-containing protein [Pseudomonas xantholysinigenes]
MNTRVSIFGKGQGLEGDLTSTGAICIASQARGKVGGRRWLLQGDKTTACPHCGEEGTLVNGETRWRQDGIPSVVDGTPVKCGCPPGSNYVIAQSQHQAAPQAATTPHPKQPRHDQRKGPRLRQRKPLPTPGPPSRRCRGASSQASTSSSVTAPLHSCS